MVVSLRCLPLCTAARVFVDRLRGLRSSACLAVCIMSWKPAGPWYAIMQLQVRADFSKAGAACADLSVRRHSSSVGLRRPSDERGIAALDASRAVLDGV